MRLLLGLILGLLLFPQLASAQSNRNPCIYLSTANTNCVAVGTSTNGVGNSPMPVGGLATASNPTFVEGKPAGLSFDLSGALRTTAAGGGGGSVTQGTVPWVISGQGTAGSAATGVVTVQGIASGTPIPVSGSFTPSGTQAISAASGAIASGSMVDLGSQADAACGTGTGTCSLISLAKYLNTVAVLPLPAGTNIVGKVGIDQTTPGTTNLVSLSAETTKVIGTVNQGTSPWVVSGTVTVAANQSVNVAQVNGVTTSTGTGAVGTGTQRIAIGTDTATIGGSAPGTAGSPSTNVVSVQGVSSGTVIPVSFAPSSSSALGITPVVSAAAEATHVLKASAGNAYSAYATNLTATNGFLVLLNSTSAPADGAITPLACAPLSANGNASINYAPGPPGVFSTGITAVVTSATTCFTKTTGTITAFISGSVQ